MLMRVDPLQQVDHLLRSTLNGGRAGVMPMDSWRHGDGFIVELDLPGVDRDSIDVTVERNVLQITARRSPRFQEGDEVTFHERPHGVMTRQLLLAEGLDTADITASYDDGVLRLSIPVSEEAKPRTIAVAARGHREQAAVGAGAAA